MNQNQCVPNWDLDDVSPNQPPQPTRSLTSRSHSTSLSAGHDTSMLDNYEVAELAWENGQLTMHGLGMPRVPSKNNLGGGAWNDKPFTRACGTLESVVNQATYNLFKTLPFTPVGACDLDDDLVPTPFYNTNAIQCTTTHAAAPVAMDALVPTNNNVEIGGSKAMGGCSTRVGSCSVATTRVPAYSDWSASTSGSERWQSMKRPADDTCEQLKSITYNGMTSTSFGASMDNTTTRTVTFDDHDHDSACHSRPQRERGDEEENEKKGTGKSTSSNKRSRTAAIHNQSERKRRDKINQRMKTLQKLVPNSNKTDKASMLDEVIDYLKQLQAQVQMLNTMRLPSMMMPLTIQQQLQMSMMAPMAGMGMGMGLGLGMGIDQMNMNMNMNALARPPNVAGLPPSIMNPAAFMSLAAASEGGDRLGMPQAAPLAAVDPLSTYLACQSNPVTMDAYSRMAAMYQLQIQQLQQSQHQQTRPTSNP